MKWRNVCCGIAAFLVAQAPIWAANVGTAFTYLGRLEYGTNRAPVKDICDIRFGLWDEAAGGNQQGNSPQTVNDVAVTGGLFTVNLDFGANAINGDARWLEITANCANPGQLKTMTRQKLTPVPYALRAVQGVGPPGVFELTPTGQLILTAPGMGNQLLFDPNNWTIAALTDEGTAPLTLESRNAAGDKTKLRIDDATSSFTFDGEIVLPTNTAGITPPPKLRLALETAADAVNTAGFEGGAGVSIAAFDYYGKSSVPLRLRGNVGIGVDDPTERLDVAGNIHASGTITSGGLEVVKSGDTVAVFNRTIDDGTIVSLRQAGIEEGTIAVVGTTVSYNAFTGSHYGWTDRVLSRGSLVVMTGENRRRYNDPGTELIYGIGPSVAANDPKCLGAYLGLLEPAKSASMENPHQVMAVGNGDMWVVDTGKSIAPGDYLISSHAPGHAMLDDESRFPVGYVVARAGEGVDWAKVSEVVDASAQGSRALVLPGRKHKRISVFFESFERGSAVGLGKIVEQQQSRIEDLSRRLHELESARGGAQ